MAPRRGSMPTYYPDRCPDQVGALRAQDRKAAFQPTLHERAIEDGHDLPGIQLVEQGKRAGAHTYFTVSGDLPATAQFSRHTRQIAVAVHESAPVAIQVRERA